MRCGSSYGRGTLLLRFIEHLGIQYFEKCKAVPPTLINKASFPRIWYNSCHIMIKILKVDYCEGGLNFNGSFFWRK